MTPQGGGSNQKSGYLSLSMFLYLSFFVFVFVFVCVFFFLFVFVYLDEEGATQRFPPDDENRLQRRAPATRDLLRNDHLQDYLQDHALEISAINVLHYPRELEDLEDLDEELEDRDEELDLENQLLMRLVNKDIYQCFKHHPEQGLRSDQ